jgi:hypothetical protein
MSAESTVQNKPVQNNPVQNDKTEKNDSEFYCPQCAVPVADPLACGDCGSLICRKCGAPLERIDDLGIG